MVLVPFPLAMASTKSLDWTPSTLSLGSQTRTHTHSWRPVDNSACMLVVVVVGEGIYKRSNILVLAHWYEPRDDDAMDCTDDEYIAR